MSFVSVSAFVSIKPELLAWLKTRLFFYSYYSNIDAFVLQYATIVPFLSKDLSKSQCPNSERINIESTKLITF